MKHLKIPYSIALQPRARRLPKIYILKIKKFKKYLVSLTPKYFVRLYLPIILSIFLFILYQPTYAQLTDNNTNLGLYVVSNNVEVGTVPNPENYQQIYFEYEGKRNVITNTNYTNGSVYSNHEYVVWTSLIEGFWQVFRHHIPTKTTIQLTHGSNNGNPKVNSNGQVVWESWVNNAWQIYLYDGKSSKAISSGGLVAQNPVIEGNFVVYSQKGINGTWKAMAYYIPKSERAEISVGDETRYTYLENKSIYLSATSASRVRFPLNIDDLFVLDFTTDSAPATSTPATEQEVLAEIESLIKEAEDLSKANQELLELEQPVQEPQTTQ